MRYFIFLTIIKVGLSNHIAVIGTMSQNTSIYISCFLYFVVVIKYNIIILTNTSSKISQLLTF